MTSDQHSHTDPATGLSSQQVAQRVAAGQVNADADVKTRSIPQIVRDNVCTLFNLVNVIIAAGIIWTGAYKNVLFLGVIILNVAIGIVQEVRSKLTIDKLSVMTSSKAHVIRDGQAQDIPLSGIVIDDVVRLSRGDQVPSDCRVISGFASVNESLLTGESDTVSKREGSELYSGSFVSSGSCLAQVTAVGEDNYATRINNEAKVFKKVESQIMLALKKIIRVVTVAIVPIGTLLMVKEILWNGGTVQDAILHSGAALVGMIPQGFILLTSTVFAVSVIRLAKHKVLVQELYCVETLARVDVVCLDKTGTITTGEMDVDELIVLDGASREDALTALALLDAAVDHDSANETSKALHAYLDGLDDCLAGKGSVQGLREIPFSSERKYSGVVSKSCAACMGAAEFVLKDSPRLPEVQALIEKVAGVRRVLVVARVQGFDEEGVLQGDCEPLALLLIQDRVRKTAPQTLKYFDEQGVRINIISGDAVETVANIAASVGVPHSDRYVDMTTVTTEEELQRVARECRVFGRVTPDQKRQLVCALQDQGHTVAMTGDGVNDVLALHASDCSVAMGSGSDAARNIAQLILMDDDFASMPHVVAEGRRSINNLQRSGALFLVKTIFSMFLAVAFIAIQVFSYPFAPIQLTLISALTIGLPSFVLALEPNKELVRGNFLRNVLTRAVPGAAMVIAAVLISCLASYLLGLGQEQFSTLCVILTAVAGAAFVIRLSLPLDPIRIALLVVCVGGLIGGICLFPGFFMITPLSTHMAVISGVLGVLVIALFNVLYTIAERPLRR